MLAYFLFSSFVLTSSGTLQELMPIINWEMTTFSTPVLALVIFGSVALFPTLLLPSTPSMWVAGMTFGYGIGFLLIIAGVAVGVSLPYFIGSMFHHKIQVCICFFTIFSIPNSMVGFLPLSSFLLDIFGSCAGVVRKISKESFHCKTGW